MTHAAGDPLAPDEDEPSLAEIPYGQIPGEEVF